MSFNINPPDNKPIIREAQNMQNDGGGGNLGYMQQGAKGEEYKEEAAPVQFESVEDKFIKEGEQEPELPKEPGLIERIINFIKNLFRPKYDIPQDKDEFLSTKGKKQD